MKTRDISRNKHCPFNCTTTDNRPTTNRQPTDNQPTTNRQPTDNQPTTNRQPTDNRPTTNRQPTDNRPTNNRQPTDNQPTTDRQPTVNRPTTNRTMNKFHRNGNFDFLTVCHEVKFDELLIVQSCTLSPNYYFCISLMKRFIQVRPVYLVTSGKITSQTVSEVLLFLPILLCFMQSGPGPRSRLVIGRAANFAIQI